MNCSYHTENTAFVNCNGCGNSLCPACDHRIKGFPYCQDCIVAGVELLKNRNQSIYVPIVKNNTSPFLAAILSLFCPGLGAAYNGQTSKGLIHFLVFIGLFQLAIISGGMSLFVLSFIGMWLYAALDSFRTAQMIRSGITPDGAEDVLVRRFSGNAKLWGIALITIGSSFILQTIFGFHFLIPIVLPVLLIGIGVHLIRTYIFSHKNVSEYGRNQSLDDSLNYNDLENSTHFRSDSYEMMDDFQTHLDKKSWKNQ